MSNLFEKLTLLFNGSPIFEYYRDGYPIPRKGLVYVYPSIAEIILKLYGRAGFNNVLSFSTLIGPIFKRTSIKLDELPKLLKNYFYTGKSKRKIISILVRIKVLTLNKKNTDYKVNLRRIVNEIV